MAKKILIWNRVRLYLRGKTIIVNQILCSKLWYIGQIYTIPKYIKKEIEKGIYNLHWNRKKRNLPDTQLKTLHLEGRTKYLKHRHAIKLYKNKMDSKVIKSH